MVVTLAAISGAAQNAFADPFGLWMGNDNITGSPVVHTDTTGVVLSTVPPPVPTTGIAFDGTNLYFGNASGDISVRTADGLVVLDTFTIAKAAAVCCAEDLAWDPVRDVLWRIDHSNPGAVIPSKLRKIDPVTQAEVAAYDMPLNVTGFSNLGGLGVAYDSTRDLLYTSYCHAGCAAPFEGIALTVDPNNGLVLGTLFTAAFMTGGLGYDPGTDTLWVGDFGTIRNVSLGGVVLSSFPKPNAGFADGLEFVVPEPSSLALFGLGLFSLARNGLRRRK
jgi:hypothetical protein